MNHIEATIADLTAARNRADFLIQSLQEFQAGALGTPAPAAIATPASVPVVVLPTPPAPPQEPAAARRVPRGTVKQAKLHKNAPKGRDLAEKLFALTDKLPEPFTSDDLERVAKLDRKQCENFLVHRVGKAFTRVGRGKYVRGVGQPPAETKPTRLDVTRTTPTTVSAPSKSAAEVRPISVAQGLGDKATTVGGAMKQVIRTISEFTGAQLRDALRKDADYGKLLDQSPTAFTGNLIYWSNQGYLEKDGDGALEAVFTVTKEGREWFSR